VNALASPPFSEQANDRSNAWQRELALVGELRRDGGRRVERGLGHSGWSARGSPRSGDQARDYATLIQTMVWHAARITPQPWDGVIEFYRHFEDRNDDFHPMRLLAEHIASRPYAASVFGATSGTALFVAPRADADWAQDGLRIDVGLGGAIRFVFQGRPPSKPNVFRSETQKIVDTFEGFIRKAKWG
jgi:hypothetical protein